MTLKAKSVREHVQFHLFHKWSQWSDVERWEATRLPTLGEESVIVASFAPDGLVHTQRWIQRRRCTVCNAEKVRYV